MNFTSPSHCYHTACGVDRKYILEHKQDAHNDGNRVQPLKRLLKTLFLAIKKCTGFNTDVYRRTQKYAVSLANQLRAVVDAFRTSSTQVNQW